MISSFILLFSFRTIFTKISSSWLIIELIKALEIDASMLLNLDFANNTILSCFLFFSFIIDAYFLIPKAIAQIFNPIEELVIPTGIPRKEAKAEIEIHPVIVEAKIRKCLM